jgi:hypothetical protein
MTSLLRVLGVCATVSFAAASCLDNVTEPSPNCTNELRTKATTFDTTLQMGQHVDVAVELSTCGGGVKVNDVMTWSSRDANIASVSALNFRTGRVTARAVGSTFVDVLGAAHGSLGPIRIVVVGSP